MSCANLQSEIYSRIATYLCRWQKHASLGKCTKCIEATLEKLVLAAEMYKHLNADELQKLRTLVLNTKGC